jgi:hypothetical protein
VLPVPIEDPSGRRRPPGRYDPPSKAVSRSVAVVLGVLFLAFMLVIAWTLFQRYGTQDIPLRVRGFDVVSDELVRIDFEVTPPEDGTAWCFVRARNAPGEEVGREFVPVEPLPDGGVVRVVHELTTADTAVSGEVPQCRPSPPGGDEPTSSPATPRSP